MSPLTSKMLLSEQLQDFDQVLFAGQRISKRLEGGVGAGVEW